MQRIICPPKGLPEITIFVVLFGALLLSSTPAQPPPGSPGQDPLMALMLAQPRIDVQSPVVANSSFEPAAVRAGEEAIYRLTLNALETSIQLPPTLQTRPTAELHPSSRGQLLVLVGTNYQPRTTFNFRVRPSRTGPLAVPEFTINVYGKTVVVPPAQLEVTDTQPSGIAPAHVLGFKVQQTNVYVGQALPATVTLPHSTSLVMQHSSPLQINGKGFIVDATSLRPRMEIRRLGNGAADIPTIAYDLLLTPIAAGRTKAVAQAFVGARSGAGVTFGPAGLQPLLQNYILADSEPVELSILPLPAEGKLAGFTGGIGTFLAEVPQLSTNLLRVGDPVKMTVRIRGDGNLVRLVPPQPPRHQQWRIYPGEKNQTHPQIIQAQGFTVFNFLLVPLAEEAVTTPPIPFSCFDPSEKRYVDCTIQGVPVKVTPGTLPADLALLDEAAAAASPGEKDPVLSGLAGSPGLGAVSLMPLQRQAWFPFLQLAPATAFAGLWAWDRRRRFYEMHPDILLRHQARRALRKERKLLRTAAAHRDAEAFSSGAVRALELACSPFYPANPRALVGADVLALLSENDRSGARGQVVRELFDTNDAWRFSTENCDTSRLLSLQSEIDDLLGSLDDRLRT